MEIQLISFGKISEFMESQKMEIPDMSNTDELKTYLEQCFPKLVGMKYKLALNKNMVQTSQELKNNDTIAIMPPFSGG
ncbi:molybdopterin synthase sulfur carrier subunit [Pedobacter chinensis]|uniref:Molybdopterin synthase sulfur carrier subunit n=1 Tax=Pedobacter chinensis TaxID=2282421 RepID=A0A369PZA2_9SPHI|nr:MoaD/ThiS family protein [Pedobacter chinensis]RDC57963.1 molybdopterin synthase sulfur carrier subunit [Pedobacter chinensis]